MKPVFDTETGSIYARTVRKFSAIMVVSMLVAVFVLSLGSGSAWSFESYYGHMDDHKVPSASKTTLASYSKYSSLSIRADSLKKAAAETCLPLLTSSGRFSPQNAMDRNQRSAGKAVALGLLFGVQFALTPTELASKGAKLKVHAGFWPIEDVSSEGAQDGSRNALAVAAYRRCQKKQALQALSLR